MRGISSLCAVRASDAVQRLRVAWYRRLWTCAEVRGTPRLLTPAMLAGAGSVEFDGDVLLGWEQGPGFLSAYAYIEARHPASFVRFGGGTHLNNGVTIVSEGPGTSIGRNCLIGPGVHIYDSDLHNLDADARAHVAPARAPVKIEDSVFGGTNAIILKGVCVGAGSVVGAGAVVTVDVPERAVVAGNPARVVA